MGLFSVDALPFNKLSGVNISNCMYAIQLDKKLKF